MAAIPRCNAPTVAGGRCQWTTDLCKYDAHAQWRASQPASSSGTTASEAPSLVPPPEVFENRDLRSLAWWVLEEVIMGRLESPRASVAATLVRVISNLSEQDVDDDAYLARQELSGLVMHGVPPETPEQWTMLRQLYAPSAVEMAEGWAARRRSG